MVQTIYAAFPDAVIAEKAAGELLDYGARKEDVSLITHDAHVRVRPESAVLVGAGDIEPDSDNQDRQIADSGVGLGILAGMPSMLVPGFGVVLGGGALAAAVNAAVATTSVSDITGYWKEQGVSEEHSDLYQRTIDGGGAILAIHIPSGPVDIALARETLSKYDAETFSAV